MIKLKESYALEFNLYRECLSYMFIQTDCFHGYHIVHYNTVCHFFMPLYSYFAN